MELLELLLLLAGFICFLVAAFTAAFSRVNLMALGLALWILIPLIHAIKQV